MHALNHLLTTVQARLKEVADNNRLAGVRSIEITTLPEGKAPPKAGQRFVILHPEYWRQVPSETLNRLSFEFKLSVVTRIRDIPNDEFGLVYTDTLQLAAIHSAIISAVQSHAMLTKLITAIQTDLLNTSGGYKQRWSVSGVFRHRYTSMNPIKLWPKYFNPRKENDRPNSSDKVAGYRTFSTFTSPIFTENYGPMNCNAPEEIINT